jgi:hypothetical protein
MVKPVPEVSNLSHWIIPDGDGCVAWVRGIQSLNLSSIMNQDTTLLGIIPYSDGCGEGHG